jgi:predicted GIY-YIG superfamily endonuclease
VATTTDPRSPDDRQERLKEQRRALPDQPGVYLFRDVRGRVVYVGKAKSIRKRVQSHFSNPTSYGSTDLPREVDHIEYLVVQTEAEALLTEQNFIKQYKPKFNIRLRDDKSYPYIAPTSARTRRPSASATRSICSGRCSSTARARGRRPAGTPARRAWTTTSSAAGRPASATSPRRSTASPSTA